MLAPSNAAHSRKVPLELRMNQRRILTEDEALKLLARFFAIAELHTGGDSYYTDRRVIEGALPLLDGIIRDGDPADRTWLEAFKADIQQALTARGRDQRAYTDFLEHAPGRIAKEIRRRQSA
jgi:hypothetical protein